MASFLIRSKGARAALFDGRSAWLEVPHDERLNLDGDFTISVWVHTAAVLDDTLGDMPLLIVSVGKESVLALRVGLSDL